MYESFSAWMDGSGTYAYLHQVIEGSKHDNMSDGRISVQVYATAVHEVRSMVPAMVVYVRAAYSLASHLQFAVLQLRCLSDVCWAVLVHVHICNDS